MKIDSLMDLYTSELQDIYNAEKQIAKALPKMRDAATSPELRTAFEDHLEITERQAERIESILEGMSVKPGGKTCEAMKGIISEGEHLMKNGRDEDALDAGLIVAAQKVEHYEIATYGSLRTFARMLGREADARQLQETLDEEKEADATLTGLAEAFVNRDATR